jgi:hypothetical protein
MYLEFRPRVSNQLGTIACSLQLPHIMFHEYFKMSGGGGLRGCALGFEQQGV